MNYIAKASLAVIATLGLTYVAATAGDMPGMQMGKDNAAAANNSKVVAQTKCPVEGESIDKNIYIDADGKRIYVCCKDCLDKVRKSPGRYISEMEEKGITLDKAPAGAGLPQTKCPVMSNSAIDKNLYVDVDGKRVYVCNKDCLETVKKNPAKYVKELEAQGIVLDKAK